MSKIIEILGRYTCLKCGYEWSAMMSDDEIPINCECEVNNVWRSILLQQKQKWRNARIGNVRSVCSQSFQENDFEREKKIWWKGKNKSVREERD